MLPNFIVVSTLELMLMEVLELVLLVHRLAHRLAHRLVLMLGVRE